MKMIKVIIKKTIRILYINIIAYMSVRQAMPNMYTLAYEERIHGASI